MGGSGVSERHLVTIVDRHARVAGYGLCGFFSRIEVIWQARNARRAFARWFTALGDWAW